MTLGIIFSLFVVGTQPVAVNLIPSPWDKLAHGVLFSLLTCGIGIASGLRGRRMWVIAATTALMVGLLDEYHQLYLPGRQASLSDLGADFAGIIAGTALLAVGRVGRR